MHLKKHIIGGLLGISLICAVQAAINQTSVDLNGDIVLVNKWCRHHPKRCHHRHFYLTPDYGYHPYSRSWADYCRYNHFSSLRCERFCEFNICYR